MAAARSDSPSRPPVRIGLIGFGTVGVAVFRLLEQNGDAIGQQAGVDLRIARIAVRDVTKPRPVTPPPGLLTSQPGAVVGDPEIDIVVEVAGGAGMREWIARALAAGKAVVTANKECIARHGPELLRLAAERNVDLLFEGSVGGGIPLLRPLQETLAPGKIRRLAGIINGTTNDILTRMSLEGKTFAAALAEAQAAGYAEADPTLDIDGIDAAYKLAILSSIGFQARVTPADVQVEGIRHVTPEEIAYGRQRGWCLKLVALAVRDGDCYEGRILPAFLPCSHLLCQVHGVLNAVWVWSEAAGETLFYGRGAGGMPTALAVAGDIVQAARNRQLGVSFSRVPASQPLRRREPSGWRWRYCLRARLAPGALPLPPEALVPGHAHLVASSSLIPRPDGSADLVVETVRMGDRELAQLRAALGQAPAVEQIGNAIPILDL